METLLQDARFGLRMLLSKPGYTLVAIIALALGIGANTAIFSVTNAVLLRSLPYPDADRLVVPAMYTASYSRGGVTYADVVDWRDEDQIFEHVAAFFEVNVDLTSEGEPERVQAARVSDDYFAALGTVPLLGRTFTPEEQQPNGPKVVVISDGLWQRRFAGDPSVLDRTVVVNGQPRQVVGVVAKKSQLPDTIDVWTPLGFGSAPPGWAMRRDNFVWNAVARLKPGVTIDQATAMLEAFANRIAEQYPETRSGVHSQAVALQDWIVGPQLKLMLLVLLGAVGFVLLIACVNVANLLLARASSRQKEIAIRTALGASRGRLVRQLLTESFILSAVAGAAGLLLAVWGGDLLIHLGSDTIPRLSEASIDGRVLGFVVAVSLATTIAFGLIPALYASKPDLNETLKEGGRGSGSGVRGNRMRSLLVVAEVAFSLVLLLGAGLMIRSFIRLQQVDPGFRADNVVTFDLTAPRARYAEPRQIEDFYRRVIERVGSVPGVQSAAATSALPVGGGGFYLGRAFLAEGQAEPPNGVEHEGQWNVITPGYFNTLGIQLVRGRDFNSNDGSDTAPVMIINETMARKVFGDADPIGKRIRSWRDENVLREVVGVVRDVRYLSRDDKLQSIVYVPHSQDTYNSLVLAVHTTTAPSSLVDAIRGAVASVDNNVAVANVKTMDVILDESVAGRRLNMMLLGVFAAVALVLAAVGIYGILSYAVAQRSHEIGIRMALGAKPSSIMSLVLGRGLKLVLIGIAIGLAGALALTRVMESLLYDVSATDLVTFIVIPSLLTLIALLSSYIPARRALKVDPMIALRSE